MATVEVNARIDPRDIRDARTAYKRAMKRNRRQDPLEAVSSVSFSSIYVLVEALTVLRIERSQIEGVIKAMTDQAFDQLLGQLNEHAPRS